MKIFIAGATGVLGRRLILRLRSRGHQVVGMARDDRGRQLLQRLGAEGRAGDLFDLDSLVSAAEGADVLLHAATSLPVKRRVTLADFEANDRIRREGTALLAACAGVVGAGLYVQPSTVRVARPPDGSMFTEASPPSPDPVSLSAFDGEQVAVDSGRRFNFKVAVLRFGSLYGADSAHTKMIARDLLRGHMPVVGSGDFAWTLLHLDDAASAIVTAIEASLAGVWHVVDERPVTMREFLLGFAERLGAPKPLSISAGIARMMVGSLSIDLLTSPVRTSNSLFRRDFDWEPEYPSFDQGLDQIVAEWQHVGLPESIAQ